ncbi:MAG TPA: DNA replication/repair protein RecF [Sediminispirochaeta sp.]|nr:DNA replication/repair protein RecF [Sediminispirochaeta sp.]
MAFTSITSYGYRNLQDQKIPLEGSRIFLVGENGQGKSNFLEAVYLLSYGSSFRTNRDRELITMGKKEMALHGSFVRPEDDELAGTVALNISPAGKTLKLNDKKIQDRKELISNIPAVVFSHEDMDFVNGSPDRRRWFFNQIMSLFDPLFIDTLRDYRKILKMRNASLKNHHTDLLPVYDQQIAQKGLEIQQRRRLLIDEYNQVVAPIFNQVSGLDQEFFIEYRPSWKNADNSDQVAAGLERRRSQDLLYGTSTSGPHRDRFIFRLGKTDFARIASTGQLRLISLILRIGQCRYFSQKTGRRPVLLLDDVLLELDGERRKRFLAQLPDYEQVFFTFLPDEKYLDLGDRQTNIFRVNNGWIKSETIT